MPSSKELQRLERENRAAHLRADTAAQNQKRYWAVFDAMLPRLRKVITLMTISLSVLAACTLGRSHLMDQLRGYAAVTSTPTLTVERPGTARAAPAYDDDKNNCLASAAPAPHLGDEWFDC